MYRIRRERKSPKANQFVSSRKSLLEDQTEMMKRLVPGHRNLNVCVKSLREKAYLMLHMIQYVI